MSSISKKDFQKSRMNKNTNVTRKKREVIFLGLKRVNKNKAQRNSQYLLLKSN